MVRGQWWEFGQDTGVTPLVFTRSAKVIFNKHRESAPRLTSHPKVAYICLCFTSRLESHTILIKKIICKALLHKATKYTIELHFPCLYIYIYI